MQIILKGFAQEVDLSSPERTKHILVFAGGNTELRLPVSEETIKALVQQLYAGGEVAETATTPSPVPSGSSGAPAATYEPPAENAEDPLHTDEDLQHASEFGGEPGAASGGCPNCSNTEFDAAKPCSKCGYYDGPMSEEEVGSL